MPDINRKDASLRERSMKLTLDDILFAAIACAIVMVTLVNGDAFVSLGRVLAG